MGISTHSGRGGPDCELTREGLALCGSLVQAADPEAGEEDRCEQRHEQGEPASRSSLGWDVSTAGSRLTDHKEGLERAAVPSRCALLQTRTPRRRKELRPRGGC